MTLIAMLLALIAEHFASHIRDRGLWGPRGGAVAQLRARLPNAKLWQSRVWLIVLLLVPTAIVEVIRVELPSSALRMLWGAAVLFVCLGPRDLGDDLRRLRQARKAGDTDTVNRLAAALKSGPEPHAERTDLLGALFIQSHERLFGPLIWFMVCGPAGALFYRLAGRAPHVYTSADSNARDLAHRIHAVAAWVPGRVTALLFGLAGSVDSALRAWRHMPHSPPWQQRTWQLLAKVPTAALALQVGHAASRATIVPPNLDDTLTEVQRMQRRTLLILLALFAIYTGGGWLT